MKKVLSVMAVSAFVLTAGVALAGGPGKKQAAGCPEACQQQIDDLQSSQAQQNEQLGAHGKQLENHEGRIKALETSAYNPWYARVGVRAAWMSADTVFENDNSSNVGLGGAIAFGRQFGQFRTELELAHQKTDMDNIKNPIGLNSNNSSDIQLTTVMANGYYEIPVADAFSVYGMAGVGYGLYDLTDKLYVRNGLFTTVTDLGDNANTFVYKIGAGVTYNFADNMAADLGYEYLGVGDNGIARDVDGHNVVASFRFKF